MNVFRSCIASLLFAAVGSCCPPKTATVVSEHVAPTKPAIGEMRDMALKKESHLRNVRQLTFGGDNAEAYWSFGGDKLILQSNRSPYQCDQIMTMDARYGAEATLVSTGKGRTTCSYFMPGDREIVYASTHHKGDACPPPPDMSQGYVWGLFDFDIFKANADGTNLRQLTDTPGYDAEATVCAKDGSIIFTSTRNGDLDLYRMDADGKNVVQLTHSWGYDGGAFFSADCSKIVWRASRPSGESLEDYQRLLKQNLVRPTKLELFVANADGTDARQITYLGVAAFGPFFHPNGKRILFSTNYPNPRGREFDIWSVNVDGTNLERITWADGFDGFPMFSPDGKTLAFSSNRRDVVAGSGAASTGSAGQGSAAKPTELYRATGTPAGATDTNVFLADWIEDVPEPTTEASTVDRFASSVNFLADDAREGRGVGTEGLRQATGWLVDKLREAGAEPALPASGPTGSAANTFLQPFEVTTAIERGKTTMTIDGTAVAEADFAPLAYSKTATTASAGVVDVGWGIVNDAAKLDDYKGKGVKGKFVIAHRFVPPEPKLAPADASRLGDIQYKAFLAKQRGAVGLIIVDDGDPKAEEAKLPTLAVRGSSSGDAGIAVVAVTRNARAKLAAAKKVSISVNLQTVRTTTENVIGIIRAKAENKLPGVVVVGAHLDHLGNGGSNSGSLDQKSGVHNGADDNASGVAGLIEVTRLLAGNTKTLRRDVIVVGFSAEEMGVLGSTYMTKHLDPSWGPVTAMLNMDMIGRMRNNSLSVFGTESAQEWESVLAPLCKRIAIDCGFGGSGYGPSDHMPFYIAGVPVLHFFSGTHLDYHRASDDAATINAAGGAAIARLVAAAAEALVNRETALTYKKVAAPPVQGDVRASGASLGTVPAYNDEPNQPPGAPIADVVPDGAAAKAGLKGGDRIVKIGATEIRSLSDMMFVLQNAKPGDAVKVTVMRGGKLITVDAVLGQRRR